MTISLMAATMFFFLPTPAEPDRLYRSQTAGGRFFNPWGAQGRSFWNLPGLLLSRRRSWPSHAPVNSHRPPLPENADDVIVTFIGHSTFLIQTQSGNILTDPIFSARTGPGMRLGPRRVREPGVAF